MNLTQRSVSVLCSLILVGGCWTPSILADCTTQTEISQVECEALVDLYTSTNGAFWTDNTNWATDDFPCSWYGVTCTGSSLTDLSLGNNNLAGPLPTSLGNLTSLEYLYLRYNQLTGAIPTELGNLANLRRLNLRGNQLIGSIPIELGNLANLMNLDLATNQLNGTIPTELGSLVNLEYLSLSGNQLGGSIPTELGSLSNLETLSLYNNQLNDTIPTELGNLVNLRYLGLHRNQLIGSIPAVLGNLSSLEILDLGTNQLNGNIPHELGSLLNLQWLGLLRNQLIGSIPAVLGNLTSLQRLYLSSNQLTGTIPSELGNLSSLQELFFNQNQLSGSIPLAVAEVGAAADTCNFTNNEPSLCIPGTPAYQAIGIDPICGLALDITCDPPVPNLSLDKSKVDFGIVSSGSIKDETVTVTNTGTINLVISSVATANPLETPFSIVTDKCSGQAIRPSQSCTIKAHFAPTSSGDYFDSFDISSNDSGSPATVSMEGYCKFSWLMFGPATTGGHQQ